MLEHTDRFRALQALQLPAGIERQVHQNRRFKMAREDAQMIAADLAKFESERRYATLVALAVEGTATCSNCAQHLRPVTCLTPSKRYDA